MNGGSAHRLQDLTVPPLEPDGVRLIHSNLEDIAIAGAVDPGQDSLTAVGAH